MEEKEVYEGNQLIATFMCGYLRDQGHGDIIWDHKNYMSPLVGRYPTELEYARNWSWLIPVVEKIESITDDECDRFLVLIYSNSCSIESKKRDMVNRLPIYISDPNAILDTKIESTWYNVVSFIKWYTQHKQTSDK